MAKRGDVARDRVRNTIISAFGENFVCEQDKKIYVLGKDDSGELIQFSISLTMPKNPVGPAQATPLETASTIASEGGAWGTPIPTAPAMEVTDEDKAKVDELMKILGIF